LSELFLIGKGLIQGIKYPLFAEHAAEYMAETLFRTSDLYLKVIEKMERVGFYSGNGELCDLTQKVIFMNPFLKNCSSNKKLHESLNDILADIQGDNALKLEIIALRESFRNNTQALIHGDLHTSSVLVNQKRTVFIDPEVNNYRLSNSVVQLLWTNRIRSRFTHWKLICKLLCSRWSRDRKGSTKRFQRISPQNCN
jgi:5-methylthioribose kinase